MLSVECSDTLVIQSYSAISWMLAEHQLVMLFRSIDESFPKDDFLISSRVHSYNVVRRRRPRPLAGHVS
jgi:hypothetical protein